MSDILTVSNVLTVLGLAGGMIAFVAYYSLKGRTSANKDLVDVQQRVSEEAGKLVETLEKRLTIIESDLRLERQRVSHLEGEVRVLREQNLRSHTIIMDALVKYFEANPEKADAFGRDAIKTLQGKTSN